MATGFPVKANYATGDVLTAANLNDMANTLNYLDPTAKGDLFPASDASTLTRLAVGSDGQVLTADSTAATGMKWATGSVSGSNFSLLNAGGTALTGAATITVSGISGKEKLIVIVEQASSASAASRLSIRFNADSGANYVTGGVQMATPSSYGQGISNQQIGLAATSLELGYLGGSAVDTLSAGIRIDGCSTTGGKSFNSNAGVDGSTATKYMNQVSGLYMGSAAITSVSIISGTGNFDAGKIYVYGSAA